jgi:hypothetical protein
MEVESSGPWCDLYCEQERKLCWSRAHDILGEAEAHGDGPMVNAMCEYGRLHFGPCLHW